MGKVVEDCFHNIHPVYHVKELMIKKELAENPEMKNEDWSRFLPQFKKQNLKKKKVKIVKKKNQSLFPAQPTPRKEDIMLETGEYFLSEQQRQQKKREEKRAAQKETSAARKREREKEYDPANAPKKQKVKESVVEEDLVSKIKAKSSKKQKSASSALL